jgi:hypothetical protein
MEELFENMDFAKQPKNTLKITLKNEDGSIAEELEITNTVCSIAASRANMWYKLMAVAGRYFGLGNPYPGDGQGLYLVVRSWNPGVTGNNYYLNDYEGYYPFYAPNDANDTTQSKSFYVYQVIDSTHLYVNNTALMTAGDTITQGANTTTITSVVDANHIQVASTGGWVGENNNSKFWTAYNYNNAISTTGTADGVYLPQSSGFTSNRGYTWTYEWGTTQGNGTLSSVAFQSGNNTPSFSQGQGAMQVAATPQFLSSNQWSYAGWKTVCASRQLYLVNRSTTTNNVVILNYTDFSLVSTETMTNPSVAGLGGQVHDIIYTPVGGGQFYAITSNTNHTFTFRTAAESANMTFGSPTTTASYSVPGWQNSGSTNIYNWTADQTYIYALVYDDANYQTAILKFDPSTNTVVSITKNPSGQGGVGGGNYVSYLFNICPVTGKLFKSASGFYVCEWPSITQPGLQRQVSTLIDGTPTYYYPTFMMEQNTDRLVFTYYDQTTASYYGAWFELTKGEFDTYAELPSVLTKTNTQSLVISYTLNFD